MGRPDHCGVLNVWSDLCAVECSECGVGPKPEGSSKLYENAL